MLIHRQKKCRIFEQLITYVTVIGGHDVFICKVLRMEDLGKETEWDVFIYKK